MRRVLLCLSVLGAAAGPLAAEPPRVVVLVTIDTLRADHLGCYGYSRPTSPFLDRLARQGVLFEHVYASSSMTAPSHASLFTGLYPPQHGVRVNDEGFRGVSERRFRTLAESLALHGYQTAAFSAVGFLRSISQGFETVDAGSGNFERYRQADATVDHVLAWLSGPEARGRFFLWVHLFDAHPPRRPPKHGPARLGFESAAAAELYARDLVERHGVQLSAYKGLADLADSYDQYDAEIRFADGELGRLFDRMEAAHLNDSAVWIVTADHGEGMGNHDWIDHVRYLYDEAIRVPLIVYAKGRWSAGTRVNDVVRHVDVAPTVFDLLGLTFAQSGYVPPGRSIRPLLEGRPMPPVFAFSIRRTWGPDHPDWERGEVFSIENLEWKYIAHSAGKNEMFDLRQDPLELHNLADQHPPIVERLSDTAWQMFTSLRNGGELPKPATDPATSEELKALGYVN
jgi:arylsulfatase A-like enzyme